MAKKECSVVVTFLEAEGREDMEFKLINFLKYYGWKEDIGRAKKGAAQRSLYFTKLINVKDTSKTQGSVD